MKAGKMRSILWTTANGFYNSFITYLPSNYIRIIALKYMYRMKIGTKSIIAPKVKIISPWKISIGDNSVVNSSVFLDGRGGLRIGNNVDIAWYSKLITLKHDYNDPEYRTIGQGILIRDNCCIAVSATILPGVEIAAGCVVGALSLVNKSLTDEYTIYAGSPCREISKRNSIISYTLSTRSITI
jgi:acetyltransferase-like isoleucine patch superfamily enzyme